VCKSLDCIEDGQRFPFYCPAYSHIRSQHWDRLQPGSTIADFVSLYEPNACGAFLRECFACFKSKVKIRDCRKQSKFVVCWVPDAPQDIKCVDWMIDEFRYHLMAEPCG